MSLCLWEPLCELAPLLPDLEAAYELKPIPVVTVAKESAEKLRNQSNNRALKPCENWPRPDNSENKLAGKTAFSMKPLTNEFITLGTGVEQVQTGNPSILPVVNCCSQNVSNCNTSIMPLNSFWL